MKPWVRVTTKPRSPERAPFRAPRRGGVWPSTGEVRRSRTWERGFASATPTALPTRNHALSGLRRFPLIDTQGSAALHPGLSNHAASRLRGLVVGGAYSFLISGGLSQPLLRKGRNSAPPAAKSRSRRNMLPQSDRNLPRDDLHLAPVGVFEAPASGLILQLEIHLLSGEASKVERNVQPAILCRTRSHGAVV